MCPRLLPPQPPCTCTRVHVHTQSHLCECMYPRWHVLIPVGKPMWVRIWVQVQLLIPAGYPCSCLIALVYAKSALDEHTQLVACEEPVILTHAANCQDPTACQEDWHNIWWNGIGHFLLDGRNPQTFCDALKHFQEMQFGHMSQGCCNLMFQVLHQQISKFGTVCHSRHSRDRRLGRSRHRGTVTQRQLS